MSTIPSSSTSLSNFASIFNAALEKYNYKTKQDLANHPLFPRIRSCESPEAILTVLREQHPDFHQSQNCDDQLTNLVTPIVNVLYSFAATLGGVVGIAFKPANIIFTGIGVLLLATKDVRASREKLIDLFNSIERFFQRLEIYTGITPTTAMRDIIIDIMAEVLTILAIATKEVKRRCFKKYLRKLLGNTEIEDSLQRLDRLTQDEARMAAAESLKVTHDVDTKVMGVDDRVRSVGGKVEDVHDDVQGVGNKVETVDGRVQDVQSDVHNVGDKVGEVGICVRNIDRNVEDISCDVREVNRNQLRESFLRWLSPSDPSINHNVAFKAHHDGTAQWFSQGDIFSQWKSTGSFLWIHGKPGSGKSILCSSIIQDIMALRDAGTASMAYFYFDFRDVHKQGLHNLLPSLLIQLAAWSDPCYHILSRLYYAHGRGAQRPSDRVMVECLKEMLNHNAQGPTYIILDALDEIPKTSAIPPPRDEVLDFVDQLVGLQLPNLHLCVTSRLEPDIQAVLEPLTTLPVSLHDESGQREDIANYVASVVESDRRAQRWRKEDRDLVIMTLTEKADGTFRWAFCQLEILLDCLPASIQHTLSELPDSLDGTHGFFEFSSADCKPPIRSRNFDFKPQVGLSRSQLYQKSLNQFYLVCIQLSTEGHINYSRDEIDKIGQSNYHGDPATALLEVLDTVQNVTFNDHHINVPIDLPQVLFICTTNTIDTIAPPILDRFEVIQLSGYTHDEKLHIAWRFLLPKQLAKNGLSEAHVQVTESALLSIATLYTREAGVCAMERVIGGVVRFKAVEWAAHVDAWGLSPSSVPSPVSSLPTRTSPTVSAADVAHGLDKNARLGDTVYDPVIEVDELEKIFGLLRHDREDRDRESRRGVVWGLVVTGMGEGEFMPIESIATPGNGHLELIGSLGNVIKESVELALSWFKTQAYDLDITTRRAKDPLRILDAMIDVHLHLPTGAQKKNGPSNGVAVVCAIVSLLTGKCVPPTTAMTGEIILRGRVLPVGGIKEKVLCAHRAGANRVPWGDLKGVEHDVAKEVRARIQFVFARTVREAPDAAFGPGSSWYAPDAHPLVESRL